MRDRLTDWAYVAGWTAVKALPERFGRAAFRASADLALRRQGRGARQLAANLRRVVGAGPEEALPPDLLREAMRSYSRYWLETFRLPVMDHDAVGRNVDAGCEGKEHLDKAHADGTGVVLALPHMGNWDAAAVWMNWRGMPITAVAERLRPESLYRRFVAYRESLGMQIVPLTGGERSPRQALAECLAANRVVCLLADRDLSRTGIEVSFFGEPATMPPGPALLAATTGAVVLPVGLWFEGDGWAQRIGPPIDIPTEGRLRDRVRAGTQALADVFEAEIAEHPTDWHMLQRLWRADVPPRPEGG